MVTKPLDLPVFPFPGSVLAKILMVTKRSFKLQHGRRRSVLAKILMVTKQFFFNAFHLACSVLAKILMVTKHKAEL